MTAPFDWAGLRDDLAKALCRADPDVRMGDANGVVEQRVQHLWRDYLDDADAALALLRTRIEAAFVPLETVRQPHCETCGTDVAEVLCAKCGEWWRDNSLEVRQATARAEAAEAENVRLREALTRLRDCDWVITLPDRMDAVRDIARQALGGEHEHV